MKYRYPCPVCYVPMDVLAFYEEGDGILTESSESCRHGCYTHKYDHGYTSVMINIRGHKFFLEHSWMEPFRETTILTQASSTLLEAARAALIEELRDHQA